MFIQTSHFLCAQVVANYYGSRKKYEPEKDKVIRWAGGRKSAPPDTPECGFDNSGCPEAGESMHVQ